ncbi:regulatory protein [Halpernia frigidisoli]|uniref:Regulatory protein RecX n=2 Tax=Halpernia frigidisoli TaxID=1125876 RepID=A0A1I3FF60_9FLAO|nr:regulatory protein [Halpernia frigidisoli]
MEQKYYTLPEIKLKMVNYCVYQDRCHKEVEQKFRDFILVQEAKDEIMLYLLRENYLNEERFTRSYIRGKFYQKHWGKNKITSSLKFKGITQKLIQKSMDEIDEEDYEDSIRKLYLQHFELQKESKVFIKKQKTLKYLIGKGYEYEIILRLTQDLS